MTESPPRLDLETCLFGLLLWSCDPNVLIWWSLCLKRVLSNFAMEYSDSKLDPISSDKILLNEMNDQHKLNIRFRLKDPNQIVVLNMHACNWNMRKERGKWNLGATCGPFDRDARTYPNSPQVDVLELTAVRALVWNNGTLLCKIDFNRNLSF